MSKKLTCIFEECGTPIIKLSDENTTEVCESIYERFQLMQPAVSLDPKKSDLGTHTKKNNNNNNNNCFLVVDDIWDFDNIGVSKELPPAVNSLHTTSSVPQIQFKYDNETWYIEKCIKYLICAECNRGPIGMMCEVRKVEDSDSDSTTRTLYLLSLQSVGHETSGI